MTSVIKYYEGIRFGCRHRQLSAPPMRHRNLHTDLVEGLSAEAPDINCWAAAMNDTPEGYPYPDKVRFEINQNKLSDYSSGVSIPQYQSDGYCLRAA
jgi:hypothetical protein